MITRAEYERLRAGLRKSAQYYGSVDLSGGSKSNGGGQSVIVFEKQKPIQFPSMEEAARYLAGVGMLPENKILKMLYDRKSLINGRQVVYPSGSEKTAQAKDDSGKVARRLAGTALIAAPILAANVLAKRQVKAINRFKDLFSKDLVPGIDALKDSVADHVKRTGVKLPKFEFMNAKDIAAGLGSGRGFVPVATENAGKEMGGALSSKLGNGIFGKVFGKLYGSIIDNAGPAYYPGVHLKGKKWYDLFRRSSLDPVKGGTKLRDEFVHLPSSSGVSMSAGLNGITVKPSSMFSPKAFLHELGHAQDLRNGTLGNDMPQFSPSFKNWLKDWYYGFVNPNKTRTLKYETRAWDNAGIAAGDELREAALDTYRNAVRGKSVGKLALPSMAAGAYLSSDGDDKGNNG